MKSLKRWNPRNEVELSDSFRPIDQLFDEMWRNWPNRFFEGDTTRPFLRPAMDVVENEDNITVRVDLPGLTSDDVHVEMEDNVLTIRGEIGDTIEKEGERYHYRERYSGSFQRSLRLPNTIDANKVDASFDNGVLNIVLPKLPQAQPKKIDIKATNKK
jgi:HSP20 family protein